MTEGLKGGMPDAVSNAGTRALSHAMGLLAGTAIVAGLVIVGWPALQFAFELPPSAWSNPGRWRPLEPAPELALGLLLEGTARVGVEATLIACSLGVVAALVIGNLLPSRSSAVIGRLYRSLAALPPLLYALSALIAASWLGRRVGVRAATAETVAAVVLGLFLAPHVALALERGNPAWLKSAHQQALALGATTQTSLLRVVLPSMAPRLCRVLCRTLARALTDVLLVTVASGIVNPQELPAWNRVVTLPSSILLTSVQGAGRGTVGYRSLFFIAGLAVLVSVVLEALGQSLSARWMPREASSVSDAVVPNLEETGGRA